MEAEVEAPRRPRRAATEGATKTKPVQAHHGVVAPIEMILTAIAIVIAGKSAKSVARAVKSILLAQPRLRRRGRTEVRQGLRDGLARMTMQEMGEERGRLQARGGSGERGTVMMREGMAAG